MGLHESHARRSSTVKEGIMLSRQREAGRIFSQTADGGMILSATYEVCHLSQVSAQVQNDDRLFSWLYKPTSRKATFHWLVQMWCSMKSLRSTRLLARLESNNRRLKTTINAVQLTWNNWKVRWACLAWIFLRQEPVMNRSISWSRPCSEKTE